MERLNHLSDILPSTWSDLAISLVQPESCKDVVGFNDDTRIFVRISDLQPSARGKRGDLSRIIGEADTILLSACQTADDHEAASGIIALPRELLDRCEALLDDAFERGGLVCMVYANTDRLTFWRTILRAFAKPDAVLRIVDFHGVTDMQVAA